MDGAIDSGRGDILVIGYGSTLRSDDGVGPHVAAVLASRGLAGLKTMAVHQLAPELAEPLAVARLAIFVDARPAAGTENIEVVALQPSTQAGSVGHSSDPRSLLALAQAIYGRSPPSWLVTVPAANLSLGESLSDTAARGAQAALAQIAALIRRKSD